jgi:hypothetical protein
MKLKQQERKKVTPPVRILMSSKSGFEDDEVLIKLIVGVVKHVTIDEKILKTRQEKWKSFYICGPNNVFRSNRQEIVISYNPYMILFNKNLMFGMSHRHTF